MLIFLITITMIILLGILINPKSNKKKKIFLILSFSLLAVIAGIRNYTVGIDTHLYYKFYLNLPNVSFDMLKNVRYEFGFSLLCKILSTICKNPQFLLLITSIFINYAIGNFIYKNSKNVVISTILYIICNYYFSYMNIMRQAIAISIILLGYEKIKKEKYITYSIYVLFASFFHFSAISALVLIVLRKFNFNKKFIVLTIIISVFVFMYGNSIFEILATYSSRLNEYVGTVFVSENYYGALLEFLVIAIQFIFGFLIINKYKPEIYKNKNENLNTITGIIAMSAIIAIMVMKIIIFNRFLHYFSIFSIIWIANCLELIPKAKNRLLWIIIILSMFFIYFLVINTYRPEWYGVIPYNIYQ